VSDGAGVVEESRSLDLQEPLTGVRKFTLFGVGRHHLRKGAHADVLQVSGIDGVTRYRTDGTVARWLATDGVSTRLAVDGNDTPTLAARIVSHLFGGVGKHLSLLHDNAEVLYVSANGRLGLTGTTVTSANAGVATTLPSAPVGYLTIEWNGTPRRVPFYAV
jgi:hypothetical protein